MKKKTKKIKKLIDPKINILGVDYTITYVKLEDIAALGECDTKDKLIKIAVEQSKDEAIGTLYHEIGHAILFESAVYYGVSREILEVITEQFAKVFSKITTKGIK